MLALALTAALALSGPGTLDRSFGGDGRVVTPTRVAPSVAGIESLPGGPTLLVGSIGPRRLVLLRYRMDGSIAKRSSLAFDRDMTARDTALDSRGRLLVAGSLGDDALLLRFDRAGHLDPTFDRDGIAVVDFGAARDEGLALAVAPDGSIVLAAESRNDHGGSEMGIARLSSRGAVRQDFGHQGFVFERPYLGEDHYTPRSIAVEPSGVIDIGYDSWGVRGAVGLLTRLTADGAPGPSLSMTQGDFGDIAGLAVGPRAGQLLVAGADEPDPTGRDRPWVAAVDAAAPRIRWQTHVQIRDYGAWSSSLAVDSSGRAVIAGIVSYGNEAVDRLVARFRRDGRIDRCFGRRGTARVFFHSWSYGTALTIDGRGRIVIAGPTGVAEARTPHQFELARLRGGAC
jgi:uncharacterized delta-60 repeat protein